MSDTAGAAGTANMHDNGDERYVKPSVNAPVVITSYRALLACNGNFDFGLRVKEIFRDEDAWSTIVNVDMSEQEGRATDNNWELARSNE